MSNDSGNITEDEILQIFKKVATEQHIESTVLDSNGIKQADAFFWVECEKVLGQRCTPASEDNDDVRAYINRIKTKVNNETASAPIYSYSDIIKERVALKVKNSTNDKLYDGTQFTNILLGLFKEVEEKNNHFIFHPNITKITDTYNGRLTYKNPITKKNVSVDFTAKKQEEQKKVENPDIFGQNKTDVESAKKNKLLLTDNLINDLLYRIKLDRSKATSVALFETHVDRIMKNIDGTGLTTYNDKESFKNFHVLLVICLTIQNFGDDANTTNTNTNTTLKDADIKPYYDYEIKKKKNKYKKKETKFKTNLISFVKKEKNFEIDDVNFETEIRNTNFMLPPKKLLEEGKLDNISKILEKFIGYKLVEYSMSLPPTSITKKPQTAKKKNNNQQQTKKEINNKQIKKKGKNRKMKGKGIKSKKGGSFTRRSSDTGLSS
jgi:hypothetical protein